MTQERRKREEEERKREKKEEEEEEGGAREGREALGNTRVRLENMSQNGGRTSQFIWGQTRSRAVHSRPGPVRSALRRDLILGRDLILEP
eukprot:288675-Rhodomonas_salina.2